ncbi:MAG TPA: HAMP domain-containing protein, partial [Candidatus Angelobacter sp.]|nr:HAMP domain-containing protein [Candidatus Angelobacter sp.]
MKSRIFLKLFTAALILIAACMLTMNVLIQRAWEGMLRSEIETSMREKTLMLASRIASTPSDQRIPVLQRAAAEAGARATLIDSNGAVLFDSEADPALMDNHADRPEVVAALHGQVASSTRLSRSLRLMFLYEAVPVPGGVVRLAYRLSAMDEVNRQVRSSLVKTSAVAALLALALAFVATQSIGRRLVRITAFAERVAAGDLSARIQEEASDEIAHVATALDKTARKLEDTFRAVESSRQTLETLLNSMQEPVIAVAEDGRVLWANQRMERLLPSGVRLNEPLVKSARDPEILRAVQSALESRDIVVAR